ncbi:hypothetical protein R6Y99_08110 [Pseudomonas lundensis]|uniref:hypothetical protein n=1 Tax=Serratia proteamaculans TaxID=28151 RepID=UPI002981D073|nr:hypothetical protein [Serratia proteamaculans]MDW5499752.1 hypothetical protein [Serratia proteamaculans]MDW5504817.1 hypothetical protein [Pseudomonas lundensis]
MAAKLQVNISNLGLDAIKDSPKLLAMLESANNNLILKNKVHSEVRQQINSRLSRLKIMMNPEEEYCKKIILLMDEMICIASKMKGYTEVNLPSLYSEMAGKTTDLTKEVQGFLKSEWDKVKKAEL